jgi:hypothetical protein
MGMGLAIETDPPLPWPDVFLQMDTKYFHKTMFGHRVEILERHLKLDLTTLKHCALDVVENSDVMDDPEWADEVMRTNELAWQRPRAFIDCLQQLAERLEEFGDKLPPALCKELKPEGGERAYYRSRCLFSDVSACLAAIRQLRKQGGAAGAVRSVLSRTDTNKSAAANGGHYEKNKGVWRKVFGNRSARCEQ